MNNANAFLGGFVLGFGLLVVAEVAGNGARDDDRHGNHLFLFASWR